MDSQPDTSLRIDAHHHVWDLAVRDLPWTRDIPVLNRSFSMANLRPHLRRAGIGATVVVQTSTAVEETTDLLALAARDEHVRAVVGWTDVTDPAIGEALDRLQEGPGGTALAGIRHAVQDEPDNQWLHREEVHRGVKAIGAAGLVYELLVRQDQLPMAVKVVEDLPEVSFVLNHAGNPEVAPDALAPWAAFMGRLGRRTNVAVKLSGLVTRSPTPHTPFLAAYTDVLLNQLGPERVMFGSDWPVCLLAASYDQTVAVAAALTDRLSPYEQAQVHGGTAARWYRMNAH
ncbi:amidohydrolase family protein [Streptomyces sp. NPDC127036]|uniref:amidohydrolase family protein n=1 Tax=Streptomyces sp. NPDC127036 TaxID=3347112 RepID=UPI00365BC54D